METVIETQTTPAPAAKSRAKPKKGAPVSIVPKAVQARAVPKDAPLNYKTLFLNRELSWLDFNWRVLAQARDARWPLLERIKFLAIAYNNLDEFFRKRVGALMRQEKAHVQILSPDGRTATEQLELVRPAIGKMYRYLSDAWQKELRPALRKQAGVEVVDYQQLSASERKLVNEYYQKHLFPILTPLGVDSGHPFPFISNLSLSLAVVLRHPTRGSEHFARLKVPTQRHPWIRVGKKQRYVPTEQVIAHNISGIFRGMEVVSVSAFRVTRNADLSLNEHDAEDLLELVSEEVKKRRFAHIVRLEITPHMPPHVREMLMAELELEEDDVYTIDGMLDLNRCFSLGGLNLPEHRYKHWEPITPIRLRGLDPDEGRDIFSVIREDDLLVHHPYESFAQSTQKFLEAAASDPRVVAIKQTLYRTSSDSPIVRALLKAAENGKEVTVLIEVKASLDEERNIAWANMMSEHGIHVTYGLVGLKTHAKTMLVLREEEDGLRTYCHIGTGNYNPTTARIYTDLGLLTCDPDIGSDVVNLFHYLTAYAPEQNYKKLIVAPKQMSDTFSALIDQEIANQKQFGNGHIMAKMNALDDVVMIKKLYEASQQGVQIDLIVRGHSRLRPQLPGFSDNIRLISIIGRFLEHSRIYYFGGNGNPKVFMGSADWQRRNLESRVEVCIPIENQTIKERMIRILSFALSDNRLAWEMQSDGQYIPRRCEQAKDELDFHDNLMKRAAERAHVGSRLPWDL